jgi:hypothetical protein
VLHTPFGGVAAQRLQHLTLGAALKIQVEVVRSGELLTEIGTVWALAYAGKYNIA